MPDVEGSQPTGLVAYDLSGLPSSLAGQLKTLLPLNTPLPSFATLERRRADAGRRERERAERQAALLAPALVEWEAFRGRHAGDRVVQAVLTVHYPEAGMYSNRVTCSECRESDYNGASPVEWACGTYLAVRAAADG